MCQPVPSPTHHQPNTPQMSGSAGNAIQGEAHSNAVHACSMVRLAAPSHSSQVLVPRVSILPLHMQKRACAGHRDRPTLV